MGLLSEGLTQVVIPVSAFVGIGFALFQWFLVSRVKVSATYGDEHNGYKDRLIEEDQEEGIDNLGVTIRCAEIQNAISVGQLSLSLRIYIYIYIFFLYVYISLFALVHVCV